jgi:hypothetical protein
MSIKTTGITGQYGFAAAYIGTSVNKSDTAGADSKPTSLFAALKGTLQENTGQEQVMTVNVAEGVPYIYGSVSMDDGSFPTGTTVTLTDPSGTTLQPSQVANVFVNMSGNSVQSFVIAAPAVGQWKVTATFPETEGDAHVYFSTIPQQDAYATMYAALAPHVDPTALGPGAAANTMACWVCKLICYALALIFVAVLTYGMSFLTLEAACVGAIAEVVSLSTANVLALLRGLAAAVAGGVAMIAGNFCSWINACDAVLSVDVDSPGDGSTQSGTITIKAKVDGPVTKVVFTLTGQEIGHADQSPFNIQYDTTQTPNGQYTLTATALQKDKKKTIASAVADPINITISN